MAEVILNAFNALPGARVGGRPSGAVYEVRGDGTVVVDEADAASFEASGFTVVSKEKAAIAKDGAIHALDDH
jgi:hypothetical protein